MKQCITNPNEVDWVNFWAERLENKIDKNWDEAAPGFYKRTRKEDYQTALFDKLILDENDVVLDVGCGEGSITIPIAKQVKNVFITIFGPENKKLEKDFEKEIGIKTEDFPDYDYFFNILFNLGIYANVERFDLNNYKKYNSIDEAMDNGKFRIELYDDGQKDLLRKYLQKALTYDEESKKYYNVKDKAYWILIWCK